MVFNESASGAPPDDEQSGARSVVRDMTAASKITEEGRAALFRALLGNERYHRRFVANHQSEKTVEPVDYARTFCDIMGIQYPFDKEQNQPNLLSGDLAEIIRVIIHNVETRLHGEQVTNIDAGKVYRKHGQIIRRFVTDFWLEHSPEDVDCSVVLNKLKTFLAWLEQSPSNS